MGRPIDFANMNISIHGSTLTRIGSTSSEQTTKFLGLYMDESLTWKHHIAHIKSKISRALFVIKQARYVLPKESLLTLYFALIHPHLNYGILAWGNANQNVLKSVNILQKRATRIINKVSYNSHTDPLFRESSVLKIADLYELSTLMFMHKFKMNKLPRSFNNIHRENRESQTARPTRQSEHLYIRRCDSTFSMKLPIYNFPLIWNKWIDVVPIFTSHSLYKARIRDIMFSKYEMKVKCKNSFCIDCNAKQ